MQNARAEAAATTRPKLPKRTLQKVGDRDDIENFLSTFERIAKQQDWPKEVWATQVLREGMFRSTAGGTKGATYVAGGDTSVTAALIGDQQATRRGKT